MGSKYWTREDHQGLLAFAKMSSLPPKTLDSEGPDCWLREGYFQGHDLSSMGQAPKEKSCLNDERNCICSALCSLLRSSATLSVDHRKLKEVSIPLLS